MVVLKLPYNLQWIRNSNANYGVRAVVDCSCGLSAHESLILEGSSHDEEPWISSGTYRCHSCGRNGSWEPADDCGQNVGETGFATPDAILLSE